MGYRNDGLRRDLPAWTLVLAKAGPFSSRWLRFAAWGDCCWPRWPAVLPCRTSACRGQRLVATGRRGNTLPAKEAKDGPHKCRIGFAARSRTVGLRASGDGHGFEVKFPLPDSCRCEKCGHEEAASYEYKNTVYVVRDLDLWGQPSFLIFQPCFHRCSRAGTARSTSRRSSGRRSCTPIALRNTCCGRSGPTGSGIDR